MAPTENLSEIQFLETCRAIYKANHGHSTPSEELILNLVDRWKHGGLTADDVEIYLKEFQDNFDNAIDRATIDMFAQSARA